MVPLLDPSSRSVQRTGLWPARSLRERYDFPGGAGEIMIGSASAFCGKRNSARLPAEGAEHTIFIKNEYLFVKIGSVASVTLPFSLQNADSRKGTVEGLAFFVHGAYNLPRIP